MPAYILDHPHQLIRHASGFDQTFKRVLRCTRQCTPILSKSPDPIVRGRQLRSEPFQFICALAYRLDVMVPAGLAKTREGVIARANDDVECLGADPTIPNVLFRAEVIVDPKPAKITQPTVLGTARSKPEFCFLAAHCARVTSDRA